MFEMPASSRLARYGSALLALLLATLLRLLFDPVLGNAYPFPTYFVAVVIVAWYGGLGPALLTLFAGGLLADYLFALPRGSLWLADALNWLAFAFYVLAGLLVITLTEWSRRNRMRAESAERGLKRLLEAGNVGIGLVAEKGPIEYANPALLRMLGYTAEEVAASQVRWDRITAPEFAHVTPQVVREIHSTGAEALPYAPYEKEYVAKDGRRVPVLISLVPFELRADGTGVGAMFVTDLTPIKQAQEALLQSEERLRLAAQAAAIGWFDIDLETGEAFYSPEFKTIFGLPADTCTADDVSENPAQIPREDRRRICHAVLASLNLIRPDEWNDEHRTVWPDGSVHWVLIKCKTLFAREGTHSGPVRALGAVLDITERKLAEEALRESEARYRQQLAEVEAIYQSAPVGLCVLDRDLRFVRVNARLAELNGLSAAAHLGKTVREILPQFADQVEPRMRRIIATGEPALNVEISGESPSKPGLRGTWVESWLPLRDESGRVVGINVVAEDITERKRMEEALRESERRTRLMADALPAYISYVDREERYRFNNAAYEGLFHQPKEQLLGRTVREVLGAPAYDAIEDYVRRALAGETVRFELDVPYPGGPPRAMNAAYIPHVDESGRVQGYYALIQDVTERKRMEQALREREAELQEAQRLAQVGSWDWDARTDTTTWSDEQYRLFGLDTGLPAPRWADHAPLFTPESFERLNAAVEQARQTGTPYELDMELVRPDGTRRHIIGRGEVKRDADGRIVGLRGTTQDITERKRAEQTLRQRTHELQAIYQSAPAGLCVLDTELRFVRVNERMAEMNGIPSAAHIGRTVREVLPQLANQVEPLMRGVIATGEPLENLESTGTTAAQPGRQRTWIGNALPLRNDAGKIIGINVLIEEITERKRMEQALRAGEKKYRDLVENLYEGIWLIDRDHITTFVNARLAEMFGYRAEEMLGRSLFSFMDEAARAVAEANLARGARGVKADYEFEFRRKDGTPMFTHLATTPLYNEAGEYRGALAGVVDITERKRMEAALQEARDRAEQYLHLVNVAMIGLDSQGRVTLVNRKSCELLGYTEQELLGRDWFALGVPEFDRARVRAEFEEFIAGHREPMEDFENPVLTRIGEKRFIAWHNTLIRAPDGAITGVLSAGEDITEHRRAEQALQQINRLLDTVVNTTHLLMACMDARFNFIWVNRAYAASDGKEPGFFPGKNHFALYPNEENEAIFRGVVETGEPYFFHAKPFEYKEHPERGVTYWDWGLIPVKDAAGKVERLVFTLLDVTARVRGEVERGRLLQQLAEADRRKDEFLATLAHELRNPLAPISNAFALIRRGAGRPDLAEQALGIGERQVGQLTRLVDDLLDISRISRGKITLRKAPVTVQAIIQTAIETSRPQLDAGGHWLTVEVPEEPIYLEADLTRIAQAVSNLLINAAKYTEPGGHVQLTARREGAELVIAVQDTGIGIPATLLPQVFDLFVQAGQPRHHIWRGLGIGLPLAKSLVEMHGGSIAAASPGPGQGSTFTIRLPLPTDRPAAKPAEKKAEVANAPAQTRRILVVDDDQDVANSIAMLLKTYGHEVFTFYDGPTAIEAAGTHRPDVVLLDIGMPGMDGYEVVRRLRELPALHGLRIIALTGWGQEEDRQRSLEAGFDAHLVKPVNPAMLDATLRGEAVANTERPIGTR